ncbi:MAG: flagellar biosynthetic protein FliO [Treponema sp.]|jgi:flagellar protein FliO/FliZ|nr:flagellar biosynthetic protein FliO [Treponema sp.]
MEPGGGAAISIQEPDPIAANEQALVLGEGGASNGPEQPKSSVSAILRILLVLILAAAAIYGVVFFIKRVSRRGEPRDPFLKILASAGLSPGRNIHIVAVGSQAWLVGAAEHSVNLISEIEDKDILNALFLEDSRKSAEAVPGRLPDFKSLLRRLGLPVESGAALDHQSAAENIRKRRERLKGL